MPFTKTEIKTFTLDKGLSTLTTESVPGTTDVRFRITQRGEKPLWLDLTQEELGELRNHVLFDLWVLPTEIEQARVEVIKDKYVDMYAEDRLRIVCEKDF